jgi:hypothetical protein
MPAERRGKCVLRVHEHLEALGDRLLLDREYTVLHDMSVREEEA